MPSSLLALVLAATAIGVFALRFFDSTRLLRLAAGPPGSADALFADAMAGALKSEFALRQVHSKITGSARDSAQAVDDGTAELAVVRNDVAVPRNAGTMLVVHQDAAVFLKRANARITNVSDLRGRTLAVLPGTEANMAMVGAILANYGLTPGAPRLVRLNDSVELGEQVAGLDALVVIAPLGAPILASVIGPLADGSRTGFELLDLANVEGLVARLPAYTKVDVPAGSLKGDPPLPKEEMSVVGVDHQLVARLDVSVAVVDQLTRSTFAKRRILESAAPIARFMQAPDTDKGSLYALHAGATAYYQDTEESFMDRYGDWFYIAAMVVGALGSAVASLLSTLRSRIQRSAMGLTDRLDGLRRAATNAPSSSALAEVEDAAGNLMAEALNRARRGRLDGSGLEIFKLSVAEVRAAASLRRHELQNGSAERLPPREATGAVVEKS